MPSPRTPIYQGRVIDFGLELITQPDGQRTEVEIARHPGGAMVVPLDDQGRVCLLRQYRPALDAWLWEFPAGKIDDGESPRNTAERELEEEAGLRAGRWTPLDSVVTCPGFSDEVVHLFLARDLIASVQNTEEHEHIEVHWLDMETALERAAKGEIRDAKTLVGLYRSNALARDAGG